MVTSKKTDSRLQSFRAKLSDANLKRWEIVASEATKTKVRAIAAQEGITPGVAVDALLGLGIEAYELSKALPTAPVASSASANNLSVSRGISGPSFSSPMGSIALNSGPSVFAQAAPLATSQPALCGSSGILASSVLNSESLSKSLLDYSDRAVLQSKSPSKPGSGSALQSFFDKAKQRKD